MNILTRDIDSHPYTGIRKVTGKIKVTDKDFIRKFFDGTKDYQQVKNVTMGKVYDVLEVEGFGDVEDITFIDDAGEQQSLADFFFEEVEE